MSSDDIKPRYEPGYAFAGVGHYSRMRCGVCSQPMPIYGWRKVRVQGVDMRVGKCCQSKAKQ